MVIKTINLNNNQFVFDSVEPESVLRKSGKFSSVYLGNEVNTGKAVVIKKFNSLHKFQQAALEQFINESKVSITHSNIAQTIGYTEQNGEHYIIREYVAGTDIGNFLLKRKLKETDKLNFVLKVAVQILDALEALHNNNIIHCDIRPHNILIEFIDDIKDVDIQNPKTKLIDLGLAKFSTNTNTKRAPFSLIYSPPEQVLNSYKAIDATSDLYSFAISLYELLTGNRPFYHSNPELLMHLQITQPLKADKAIPEKLMHILLQATHKHAFKLPPNKYSQQDLFIMLSEAQKKRFQSAAEMRQNLLSLVSNS